MLVRVAALLAVTVSSTSCLVLSFHPAYDPSTIVFDERLIGTWESTEIGGVAIVERGEWRSYRIRFTDRSGTMTLKAYETQIGSERFLDLTLAYGLERSLLLVPLHAVCRVSVGTDRLVITPIDYDWMLKSTEARTLPDTPIVVDERRNIVMTAQSGALKEWIRGRLGTADAFGPAVTFVKRSP